MKLKIGSTNNLLGIYVSLVGGMVILFALPLSLDFFVHIGTLAISIGCALQLINALFYRNNRSTLLVSMILLMYLFVCAVFCPTGGTGRFVSVITFIELPIFLSTLSTESNYYNFIRVVRFFFVGLSFYFLALSFTEYAYNFETIYGVRQLNDLTLGFSNPNETGMYLFACLVVIFGGMKEAKKRIYKIIIFIAMLFDVWMILKTHSRICLIMALVCVIFAFIFKKKNLPKIFKWVVLLFSFVYVPISFLLQEYLSKWTILGEAIETGRLLIYERALSSIQKSSVLFGNYGCLFENFHNTPLTILTTIGLVGDVLFYIIIVKAFADAEEKSCTSENRIAFFVLVMLLLHSAVESAFFTAGSVFAVLVTVIYILAINDYSMNVTGVRAFVFK